MRPVRVVVQRGPVSSVCRNTIFVSLSSLLPLCLVAVYLCLLMVLPATGQGLCVIVHQYTGYSQGSRCLLYHQHPQPREHPLLPTTGTMGVLVVRDVDDTLLVRTGSLSQEARAVVHTPCTLDTCSGTHNWKVRLLYIPTALRTTPTLACQRLFATCNCIYALLTCRCG